MGRSSFESLVASCVKNVRVTIWEKEQKRVELLTTPEALKEFPRLDIFLKETKGMGKPSRRFYHKQKDGSVVICKIESL